MSRQLTQRAEELESLGWSQGGAQRYSDLTQEHSLDMASLVIEVSIVCVLIFVVIAFINWYIKSFHYKKNQVTESENINFVALEEKLDNSVENDNNLFSEEIGEEQIINFIKEERQFKPIEKISILSKDSSSKEVSNLMGNAIQSKIKSFEVNIESILRNNEKEPFFDYISKDFRGTSVKIDSFIQHIMLALLLLYEAIYNFTASFSNRSSPSEGKYKGKNKTKVSFTNNSTILNNQSSFNSKTIKNKTKSLNRTILIKKRKIELMNKKNSDLKEILSGVKNISRLKKVQLVNKIISLEFDS